MTRMTSEIVLDEYMKRVDKKLLQKYNLVIKRLTDVDDKLDALVLFEGDEGSGKTNHSIPFCKYVANNTGREFANEQIHFKAEDIIQIAKSTKGKVFLWDEPALQGLKKQWWLQAQIHLIQLLMMARKNRHLFVFNIIDFSKFTEFIINRAIFMIRIYKRKEMDKQRRFFFYPRKKLRYMWQDWVTKKKKKYIHYHTIHGTMPNYYILPSIINEQEYEDKKDKAIMSIGEETKKTLNPQSVKHKKLLEFVNTFLKKTNITKRKFGEIIGINERMAQRYLEYSPNDEGFADISESLANVKGLA